MGELSIQSLRFPRGPIIVAMKGHGFSGKSTLGREIARSLHLYGRECSFLSYEDIRGSIWKTLGSSANDRGVCDDVAYQILWRIASTDLSVVMAAETSPRAIVLDSSLSNRGHLEQVLKLRGILNPDYCGEPFFFVVECRPRDEVMWQQWLESHAASAGEPSPWEGIRRDISEHKEYCMDGALCLTVDTTDSSKSTQDHAADVIRRMSSYYQNLVEPDPNLTIEEPGSRRQASWRHFSHDHSLFYDPEHVIRMNDDEATILCILCREALSGSVYGCSHCEFYLHKSCAELPHTIRFGGQAFTLGPTSGKGIIKSGECLVCYGQSGVLYSFDGMADHKDNYKWQIHPKCARLPHKLKHSCHEHCLNLKVVFIVFTCGACGTYGNVAGYYCGTCNVHFHIMCTLYLEASVIHKRHWHALVLCSIPRDETDEYYCDICATERHPDLWVYYCARRCGYEAHISCVKPLIKPCNPDVLLPENRAWGKLTYLWRWPVYLPDVRNPILGEISGSQLAWEPVDDDDKEEEADSNLETDKNSNSE